MEDLHCTFGAKLYCKFHREDLKVATLLTVVGDETYELTVDLRNLKRESIRSFGETLSFSVKASYKVN